MNPAKQYKNPRIDRIENRQANAFGKVVVDPKKVAWLSLIGITGTVGSALTFSYAALALFVVFTALTLLFGHSLGMHRLFIHKAYRCPRWLELFLIHMGTIVGIAGPLGMLRTHDLRDWAQRQHECHSYFSHDEHWLKDAFWQLFCSIDLDKQPGIELEPSIANDKAVVWMEKTWMAQQLPWAVLFHLVGGWGFVFWGIASRVLVSNLGHWVIGHLAHNEGHRSWGVEGAAVQGHNVRWTSLLTMGECWHNNHHAFPYSANFGLEDGQWDPGWWTLRLMQKLGLANDLVEPDTNNLREELVRL